MVSALFGFAAPLQAGAVVYGVHLLTRRRSATGAWLFLLGAMTSMLAWRVMVLTHVTPPPFVNPLIAIWGSTCVVGAMFLFGREVEAHLAELQPHALILDIGMPVEDGYTLMRRVRQVPADEGGRIPAISLTAHARNEDCARALGAGFNGYLAKPVDIPQLAATIRSLTRAANTL